MIKDILAFIGICTIFLLIVVAVASMLYPHLDEFDIEEE